MELLQCIVGIFEMQMMKKPALAQVDTSTVAIMLQAMSAILDAAAFPCRDQKALAACVQSTRAGINGGMLEVSRSDFAHLEADTQASEGSV